METPDTGFKPDDDNTDDNTDDDADDDNLVGDDEVAGDDGVAGDDDDNDNDVAGDDEAPLVASSGLCGKYALTHWAPDPWNEHHPTLHEGEDSHQKCLLANFHSSPLKWCNCPNFVTANNKADSDVCQN